MIKIPQIIPADQLGAVIADHFKGQATINCYVGSNAATPTTLIEALTGAIKDGTPRLPFIRMLL
ncbi:MAG: hypothetical protein U5R49_25790 [Deltaproteobacteria bacterium]|nr:hypothetical protein [Deltaproteobacteria bacterium]